MFRVLAVILLILSMGKTQAQELFIQSCEKPEAAPVEYRNDIKWFKHLYQTDDCREIANKISKTKSLSEVFLPYNTIETKTVYSWTDKFPHLYGLRNSADISSKFDNYFNKFSIQKVFISLELYKEFENITDMPFSHDYAFSYKYDLCEIFKTLPQIKTVSIDAELLTEEADKCLHSANIEVIIRDPFKSEIPLSSKVVGIENYYGPFSELADFPDLQYLGISNLASNQGGLEVLAGYNNITHLSINNKELSDIHNLGSMYNLSYLSLNCIDQEESFPLQVCESGSYLKNTDFLKELTWLRHLNLNYHNLETLADLSQLKRLEILELEGNKLETLPDLGALAKLKSLSIGGNQIKSFKDISKIKSLEFLDLSSNQITDYEGLASLERLVHLNLSNNPFLASLSSIIPPKSLKVLSLNGGQTELKLMIGQEEVLEEFFLDDYSTYTTAHLEQYLSTPAEWYEKTLKEDVLMDLKSAKPLLDPAVDLSNFKNVEFLSLRNNKFKSFPNVKNMPQLKYLDLQGNLISKINSQDSHVGIVTLDLTDNLLTQIPDVSRFTSLKRLDVTANRINSLGKLTLPKSIKNLALADNQIKSFSPLSAARFESLKLFLLKNPIKKSKFYCPINSSNADLTWFCDRLINDRDNIESDCGDWCYEPEV